ncbi:MAG TPA: hypothetical protein DCX95_03745 [Elusimicrobia bacterium]|nr:hypothetical protein [Elusimicrobiota bacterium]
MVKGFLVVLVSMVFSSLVFAETIYLKDGKILRGSITEETDSTVTFETDEQWKEINRKDIQKIVRDKVSMVKEKGSANKKPSVSFKFGPKFGAFYPADKEISGVKAANSVNLLYGITSVR